MSFANEGHSEQDTIDNLMNILPDNGYDFGESEETEEVTSESANQERQEPEQKPDNQETTDEQKPATEEPDELEIEYEGSKYTVPKELKDAFLRQQDYTKKTMELAEQRKSVGDPAAVDQFKQRISHYEALLGQTVEADAKIDWVAELEADPIGALQRKFAADARAAEWKEVSEKQARENAETHRQTIANEAAQLLAKRPEWKDKAVWAAEKEKINASLTAAGYTPEEIGSMADHRHFIIADKARKYDELMSSKEDVAKKIQKLPPKVERPGVPSNSQVDRTAAQRLQKSGSTDDAAAAIRALMSS